MDATQPLITVVVPEMNEQECLTQLHAELCRACDGLPYRFEFIIVDDGSTDQSADVLAELHRKDPRVRYLLLSRNFGQQAALSAGMAHASGDAVIMMDGDLQHPPALIPRLIERWQQGFDIVYTIRLETEGISLMKKLFSTLYYPFFNSVTSVRIETGAADFRLLSRPVVDELNAMPERQRYLKALVSWLGFRQSKISYNAPKRFAGKAKMSFRRNFRLAIDGLMSFSYFPVRLLTMVGCGAMAAGAAYGIAALFAHFLLGQDAPGWASLMAGIVFLAGLQLAGLGMIGEYVSRILEQVRGRPMYIVREAAGLDNVVRFPSRESAFPARVTIIDPPQEKRRTG